MVLPPLNVVEVELRGKGLEWLKSTCTLYDIGWLREEQSGKAIRRHMVLIKDNDHGRDLPRQA